MSGQNRQGASKVATRARDIAILVIGCLWPGEDFHSIEARLDQQPLRIQAEVTLSVLGFLILLAFFAGQFGPLGVMLYFSAVVLTVR